MYIASGQMEEMDPCIEPGNSATRLHCDMSDAVNVLVDMALPNDEQSCNGTSGAVWHIWPQSTRESLTTYLFEHCSR